MIHDNREIVSVQNDFSEVEMWSIGVNGVTKIECYGEPGEYCQVPFIAVWKKDILVTRANALRFRINYKE